MSGPPGMDFEQNFRVYFPFAFSKARTSTAIKAAINSDETIAAIYFAVGLSFHDRRP
jgi:hypothetical protein